MAWYDTLSTVLAGLSPSATSTLLDQISGNNEMVAQVNAMLLEVQRDPSTASSVATQIIAMKGLPDVVRTLAGNLPGAAKEPSGLALGMLVSQIQTALPTSHLF